MMKRTPIIRFLVALMYLLSVHGVALLIFGALRVALFATSSYELPADIKGEWLLQSVAFVKGVWFDNVVACYILAIPLLVMWVTSLLNYSAKWIYRAIWIWFSLLYTVSFSICAANIAYFEYFFKIINSSIFNWFGYAGTTAGMIFGESSYYLPIGIGVCAVALFWIVGYYLQRWFCKRTDKTGIPYTLPEFAVVLVIGVVCLGLCFLGIRGRTGNHPIRISQAYYCQDPFLNQIGINPVFNLLDSFADDKSKENRQLELMDYNQALEKAQQLLGREGVDGVSPLARYVKNSQFGVAQQKNVVFIFMESMSADFMAAYGNTNGLTPFIDSLYNESLVFDNIYSAGIHTNQGMYSTLYSFPTVMMRNAMKGSVVPHYSGLPTVLKENGYTNLFFMTHESQYDNMNAFFRTNGFDEIYSQEDYPKEKIANHFGVQDDYLYEYAAPILREKGKSGSPFFAVLLSITNHPPYVVPEYFTPRSDDIEDMVVEYADWSIRKFMDSVKGEEWYGNTIFVLMGDHGKKVGMPECEMPMSYNHVPLMVYGEGIEAGHIRNFGGQIDVAPTLLGILEIDYLQNNYGIDMLKESRPCIYYGADNLIAARNHDHLYIYSPETKQEFMYLTNGKKVTAAPNDTVFATLKEYCFAMLQSAEYMVRNGNITDKKQY